MCSSWYNDCLKFLNTGPILSSCLVADWVDGILVFTEKLLVVEGRVFCYWSDNGPLITVRFYSPTVDLLIRRGVCFCVLWEVLWTDLFFCLIRILDYTFRTTALQAGLSQVRFQIVSLEFFIDTILPATLRPWGRLSLWQKWVPGVFPGGLGSRCVGLTILRSSYADCLEIWDPQPPGTLRTCPGL